MQKQCPSAKSLIFLLQHKTCRSTGHPDNPAAPPLRTRRLRIKVTLSKHFLPHSLANKDPLPPQIQNTVIINCWQLRLHRNLKRKKMLKCMQIGCKGVHSFPKGSTVPSVGDRLRHKRTHPRWTLLRWPVPRYVVSGQLSNHTFLSSKPSSLNREHLQCSRLCPEAALLRECSAISRWKAIKMLAGAAGIWQPEGLNRLEILITRIHRCKAAGRRPG